MTGIIHVDGHAGQLIQATIYKFLLALAVSVIPITGPGDGTAERVYGSAVGGSGWAEGFVDSVRPPFPPTLHNVKGNIVHQHDTTCALTLPVLIKSLTCSKSLEKQDRWIVRVDWAKDGTETIGWNGGNFSYSQPVLSAKEVNADTSKTTDPNRLTDTASVKYFLPLGGSSDASADAAVDGFLGTVTAPRSGLKVAAAALFRLDDAAGFLIIGWALKDSVDEVVLPRTSNVLDPENLRDEAARAAVFSNGSPPSAPTTPTGQDGTDLKLTLQFDESLTPGKSVRNWKFGRNDSKDEIERSLRHGSVSNYDPNTIDGDARITIVADTSSPPATPDPPIAGVMFAKLTTRLTTDAKTIFSFNYEAQVSIARLETNEVKVDASSEDDEATIPVVDGSPAAPESPSGLVLVETINKQLPNGHVLSIGQYGRRNRQMEAEFGGSEVLAGRAIADNNETKVITEDCLAGDTLEALGAAKYLSMVSVQPFAPTLGFPLRYVKAKRITKTRVRYWVVWQLQQAPYTAQGDVIRIQTRLSQMQGTRWFGVNSSGVPFLHIAQNLTRGSGKYLTQFGRVEVDGVGGSVRISQRITAGSPSLGLSSLGKTNSSTFLGIYPPHSAKYVGVDYDVIVSDTSSTYDMHWDFAIYFAEDFVGFPTLKGMPPGGLLNTTSQLNSGSTGDWAGSGSGTYTFSGTSIVVKMPTTTSFLMSNWNQ